MTTSPIAPEAAATLRLELHNGEKLIWTGQPLAGQAATATWPTVLLGIPVTAFSLFWMSMASSITSHASSASMSVPGDGMASVFPLFGLVFVVIGLGMLTAPLWAGSKAQQTVYALTDERALILTPTWGRAMSVRSIPPTDLIARTRTQNPDGSGSLIFDRLTTTTRRSSGTTGGYHTVTVKVGFENIPDVREVDTLIEQTYQSLV